MKYKSLSLLIIALLSACTLGAQNRKKVGVVLSGGGAKGVAHIGALKVIEEAGIPIDYVVGTSMGALVGGLYSIGYTPQQLDSIVTCPLKERISQWVLLQKIGEGNNMTSHPSLFIERNNKEFADKVLPQSITVTSIEEVIAESVGKLVTFSYHCLIFRNGGSEFSE